MDWLYRYQAVILLSGAGKCISWASVQWTLVKSWQTRNWRISILVSDILYFKKGIKVEIKTEDSQDILAPGIPHKCSRLLSLTSKKKAKHVATAYITPTPVPPASIVTSPTISLESVSITSPSPAPSSTTRLPFLEPFVFAIDDTQQLIASLIDWYGSVRDPDPISNLYAHN